MNDPTDEEREWMFDAICAEIPLSRNFTSSGVERLIGFLYPAIAHKVASEARNAIVAAFQERIAQYRKDEAISDGARVARSYADVHFALALKAIENRFPPAPTTPEGQNNG